MSISASLSSCYICSSQVVELALARRGREKAEIECLSKALEGAAEEKQGLAMTLAVR